MEANNRYYKVVAKCGHVGRNNYVPVAFAVIAASGKEASAKVRFFPRVKHHHKFAILSCVEISLKDYNVLKEINSNDPYLKCSSIQEQIATCTDINERILPEVKEKPIGRTHKEKYECAMYKKRKEECWRSHYGN